MQLEALHVSSADRSGVVRGWLSEVWIIHAQEEDGWVGCCHDPRLEYLMSYQCRRNVCIFSSSDSSCSQLISGIRNCVDQ